MGINYEIDNFFNKPLAKNVKLKTDHVSYYKQTPLVSATDNEEYNLSIGVNRESTVASKDTKLLLRLFEINENKNLSSMSDLNTEDYTNICSAEFEIKQNELCKELQFHAEPNLTFGIQATRQAHDDIQKKNRI